MRCAARVDLQSVNVFLQDSQLYLARKEDNLIDNPEVTIVIKWRIPLWESGWMAEARLAPLLVYRYRMVPTVTWRTRLGTSIRRCVSYYV